MFNRAAITQTAVGWPFRAPFRAVRLGRRAKSIATSSNPQAVQKRGALPTRLNMFNSQMPMFNRAGIAQTAVGWPFRAVRRDRRMKSTVTFSIDLTVKT